MRTNSRAHERGFTMLEVMVAIVLTAIAIFGVTGGVLGAMHASANADLKATLDDDALAALSDVRMITAYDPAMLQKIQYKSVSMQRTLAQQPVGSTAETITVTITGTPAVVTDLAPPVDSQEYATATATFGTLVATERIQLFAHAPAPGSVVTQ